MKSMLDVAIGTVAILLFGAQAETALERQASLRSVASTAAPAPAGDPLPATAHAAPPALGVAPAGVQPAGAEALRLEALWRWHREATRLQ